MSPRFDLKLGEGRLGLTLAAPVARGAFRVDALSAVGRPPSALLDFSEGTALVRHVRTEAGRVHLRVDVSAWVEGRAGLLETDGGRLRFRPSDGAPVTLGVSTDGADLLLAGEADLAPVAAALRLPVDGESGRVRVTTPVDFILQEVLAPAGWRAPRAGHLPLRATVGDGELVLVGGA